MVTRIKTIIRNDPKDRAFRLGFDAGIVSVTEMMIAREAQKSPDPAAYFDDLNNTLMAMTAYKQKDKSTRDGSVSAIEGIIADAKGIFHLMQTPMFQESVTKYAEHLAEIKKRKEAIASGQVTRLNLDRRR